MADITRKGEELAKKLNPAIGTTKKILEACSLICRAAVTYHNLAVAELNRPLAEWEQRKVEHLERRITNLVDLLPETDDGPFVAKFDGDPRGAPVKIVVRGNPTGPHILYDSFGGDGIVVPTR